MLPWGQRCYYSTVLATESMKTCIIFLSGRSGLRFFEFCLFFDSVATVTLKKYDRIGIGIGIYMA